MHLILQYPNQERREALLLAAGKKLMRVVVHGQNETGELRFRGGLWYAEDGQPVSIDAVVDYPYQGGRHTNTKYSATAEIAKTATAAMRSSN